MTISTTIIKNSYSGNGSTSAFTYAFKITDDDDIQVIIRSSTGTETVKSKGTHYTVAGVGNNSGTVTFTSGNIPASGETVVLRRSTPQTQAMDLIDNDPMSADTIETAHDKTTSITQELQEQVDRSIKLSRTNTMTSTEFTVGATDRANKILAFDSSGEIQVTQELGTFRGNWSASTSYEVRDLVKDTSTNNIFICVTAHTSSGSQPLTTNTDSAKWSLIVDAASSTSSQTAAAASATAAANSATASAASASTAETHKNDAETAKTASETAKTGSETAKTAAETAKTAAETAQAAAEAALDTFDDKFLGSKTSDPTVDNDGNALTDGALYFNTTDDVMKVYDLGNTQWKQLTPTTSQQANIDTVAGISSNVTTVANNDSNVTAVAGNATNINSVASNITNVNNVGSNIASVNTAANNLADINSFANIYLGPSASAPTQDPDGSALDVGDLYFDTTQNELKVYKSSGWAAAGSTVNGTSARFTYTISGTPTSVSGVDDLGNTLAYDAGFADVYVNGVRMSSADITITSGTSVVFASALSNGDVVDVVAYGTFNVASINASNITAGTINNDRLPAPTLIVKGDGSSADGALRLNCSQNSHYTELKSAAHGSYAGNLSFTLPTSTGTNGQALVTNGSGVLSFADVSETKPTVADVSQTIAPSTATTITITGTNFVSIPHVEFVKTDGSVTVANTVSFTNATTLSVNVTLASGNYYVRIENPDGNAGRSTNNIITASTAPSFSTAAGTLGTIAGNFSGTVATVAGSSDSAITFSETTSVLTNASQANCALNSSTGVITTTDFGGSSTTPTTYNFTIQIQDAEGQTATRNFSLTSSFGATGGAQFN